MPESVTISLGDLHPALAPHPKQREVLLDNSRFKVLVAGRRFGKGNLVLQDASTVFLQSPPRTEIWIVSPSHVEQEAMWLKANELLATAKHDIFVRKGNSKGTFVKDVYSTRGHRRFVMWNGSSLYFKSGHDPDSLRGAGDRLSYIVIDEAAYLKQDAWSVIRYALMDRLGRATFISTPSRDNPRNWFYERWLWGQDEIITTCDACTGDGCEKCQGEGNIVVPNPDKKPNYKSWQFSSFDNPHIQNEEIDQLIEEENFTYADIQREIYGQFLESEGAVFTLLQIQDCEKGTFSPPEQGRQYVMGVDFGQVRDFTVALVVDLESGHVEAMERFQGTWNLQFERLSSLYRKYNEPYTLVDATQLGSSVIEVELRKAGVQNMLGVKFSGPNKQRLVEGLRVAIERQSITFPYHKQIRREFLCFEAKRLNSGHLRYSAPKSEFDDIVDAMCLAWEAYRTKKGRGGLKLDMFMLGNGDGD